MPFIEVPPVVYRLKTDSKCVLGFDAEVAGLAGRSGSSPTSGSSSHPLGEAFAEFALLQESFDSRCVREIKISDAGRMIVQGQQSIGSGGGTVVTSSGGVESVRGLVDSVVGFASNNPLVDYHHQQQQPTPYPMSGEYFPSQEWGGGYVGGVPPPTPTSLSQIPHRNGMDLPVNGDMYPPGFYDNRYVSTDVTIEGQNFFMDGLQQVRRRPEMSRMSSKRALLLAQAGGDDDDEGSGMEDGEMRNGKYPCSLCKKRFGDPASARRHERSHRKRSTGPFRKESKSNTYKCNLCQQRFSAGYTLKKHIRVHTREKPFSCDLCNEKFSQWGNLRLHMQRHLGINPYRCPYCDKAYIAPSKLEVHIRGHTNERPYGCDICCSNFKSNDDLRKHMMIHCNYKPFTCWICQKSFMQPSKLKQHMKEKHTLDIDVCKKDVTDRGVEYQIKILPNQVNSAAAFAAAAAAAAVTAAQKASANGETSIRGLFDRIPTEDSARFGGFLDESAMAMMASSSSHQRTIYTPGTTIVLADDDETDNEEVSAAKRTRRSGGKQAGRTPRL